MLYFTIIYKAGVENETDENAILKEVIENAVGRAWWCIGSEIRQRAAFV